VKRMAVPVLLLIAVLCVAASRVRADTYWIEREEWVYTSPTETICRFPPEGSQPVQTYHWYSLYSVWEYEYTMYGTQTGNFRWVGGREYHYYTYTSNTAYCIVRVDSVASDCGEKVAAVGK